jgi:V/A-type H+-transporting ATPase subunit I
MGLQMSPRKMIVAKVVSHRDLERQVKQALEEFGLFEFIDVRRQAGIVDVKRSREEETVLVVKDRVVKILEILGIDASKRRGRAVEVDDASIEDSLQYVSSVIKAVESEVLDLESKIITAKAEMERQRGIRDVANSLTPLGVDPSLIRSTEFTYTTAGIVPSGRDDELEWSLREVTDGSFTLSLLRLKRGASAAVLTVPIDLRDTVDRILSAMEFEAFSIPPESRGPPEEIATEASEEMKQLEAELEHHKLEKAHIATEWGSRILAALEVLEIEEKRIEVKSYIVYTDQAIKMWGWIPEGKEGDLEAVLEQRVGRALEVSFDRPDFAEHEAPTYISNPSFMTPTENVVKAFGVPSRHDLDPTKIMWLSFPLIFGLVFADVGQGFLILLIGLAARRAKRKGQDWGAILGYVQAGAEGLILMGLFAILGGFLFGSFFGAETVLSPLWPVFAHTGAFGVENEFRSAHMLKLSVEVGALHIMLGIILNLYNKLKHSDFKEAVVAASYLWLYWGFINLIFGVDYRNVNSWFSAAGSVNLWVPIAGIGAGIGDNGVYPAIPIAPLTFTLLAFIGPMILMAVFSFLSGMDGVVEFLEYAIGMISHTVSYARIFALNTVHIILSGVFISLLPAIVEIPMPPLEFFGVVIIPQQIWHNGHLVTPYLPLLGAVIGSLIVGILEGLLAFMHTLRLHFVEWFSKFYHAGGVEFRPYVARRLHTVQTGLESLAPNIPTG